MRRAGFVCHSLICPNNVGVALGDLVRLDLVQSELETRAQLFCTGSSLLLGGYRGGRSGWWHCMIDYAMLALLASAHFIIEEVGEGLVTLLGGLHRFWFG